MIGAQSVLNTSLVAYTIGKGITDKSSPMSYSHYACSSADYGFGLLFQGCVTLTQASYQVRLTLLKIRKTLLIKLTYEPLILERCNLI